MTYHREFAGTSLLIRAIQIYHMTPEASLAVVQLVSEAFQQLRPLAIPMVPFDSAVEAEERTRKPLRRSTTSRVPSARIPRGAERTVLELKGIRKADVRKPGPKGLPCVEYSVMLC